MHEIITLLITKQENVKLILFFIKSSQKVSQNAKKKTARNEELR